MDEHKVKVNDGLEKADNESKAISDSKANEKKLDYFKDAKDNIEDRRTGETYDKDRVEGLYKSAEKDKNDVNPIDVRENERPGTNEQVTYTKAEEEDGDDHDVVRPSKDKKLEPRDGRKILKDENNKDNAEPEEENEEAKNKAGEDYNDKKNK